MSFDLVDRIIRFISNAVLAAVIVLGFAMLGITTAHVFFRYVMNDSLTWSEELLQILLVWFCLLSASFISVRREHVAIVIFKQLLPGKGEKAADFFVSLLMFAVSVAMCYIGYRFTAFAGLRKSPALRVPLFYTYSSIFISFGVMALYELRNFLADVFDPGRKPAVQDALAPIVEAPESKAPEVAEKAAELIAEFAKSE